MSTDARVSLWSYALDRYARPGSEADCLHLQDEHGWDICELLWIAWLSERARRPDPATSEALQAARRWQREMTEPLRERRRQLKRDALEHPRLESLRQAIKQAELYAEREMLTRLEALPSLETEGGSPLERALMTCRELRQIPADAYPTLRRLLACWTIGSSGAEPKTTC